MAREQTKASPSAPAGNLELVHPIYLDVPMMTSFLAALEGGVAYGSDVTSRSENQRSVSGEAEGHAGLPSFSILNLAQLRSAGQNQWGRLLGGSEEIKLIRRHTEASLFMVLRQRLRARNDIADIGEVAHLTEELHGALVEETGRIYRSPLSEVLEALFNVMSMAGMELPELKPADLAARPQATKQGSATPNTRSRQPSAPPAPPNGKQVLSADALPGLHLMRRLKDDRHRRRSWMLAAAR